MNFGCWVNLMPSSGLILVLCIQILFACLCDNYYYMQNNQNRSASKCPHHRFSLKATHKDRRPSLNATLSMCLNKQSKNKKKQKNCACLETPVFNKDCCHATPAFILPSEKAEYQNTAPEMMRDHQKRVREYEAQLDQLYIPKPRSKNLYCNVCRAPYSEYIEHVISSEHRRSTRESLFNSYILELQDKFKPATPTLISLISGESGSGGISEDEVEIIGSRGNKRIKTHVGTKHVPAYPLLEANPSQGLAGSSQMFFTAQTFSQSLRMMQNINNCTFIAPFSSVSLNPFFSYATENPFAINYPLYCMPYQPIANFELYPQLGP